MNPTSYITKKWRKYTNPNVIIRPENEKVDHWYDIFRFWIEWCKSQYL